MRFCNVVDENFLHHFVIIKITVGIKISQQHHKTSPMMLESCWNGVETNTIADWIAIGMLEGFITIKLVLKMKIFMRQKMFLDKKRHNHLINIMVQELILKVSKKRVR